MATLKLRVSDNILDKVLWLLGQFNSEELQVLQDDGSFDTNREHVRNELNRLESGASKSYSLDQLDDLLEKTIRQHEN